LAKEHSVEAMAKIVEIMRTTADPKVAIDAAKCILARGIGKEMEGERLYARREDTAKQGVGEVDPRTLSDSQLERIHAILKEPLS
jgi:hypothetical protein